MKTRFPSLASFLRTIVCLFAAFLPVAAHAHPGHGVTGFDAGFTHPISGLDHVLAMVAVGLWAVQLGGRAVWMVPLSFLGTMIVGGALGMAHILLPFVEHGILASVLILGLLIAFAARLPLAASMGVVGLFALFHGYAHGAEMPDTAAGFGFGVGFALSTSLLHVTGILGGMAIQSAAQKSWIRVTGATISLAGLFMIVH